MDFNGKKVCLLGFGVENQAILPYLKSKGAIISIRDRNKDVILSGAKNLDSSVATLLQNDELTVLGENYLQGLDSFDIIFRSPGIPYLTSEIQNAKKAGVKITSQTKLFFDECPAKIIGITGTKGKGTTATLIKTILDTAVQNGEIKCAVHLVGNIGVPPISMIEKIQKDDWVIFELSSFQLQDLEKGPHIAVVLGVDPDHLDHHKDTEEYFASKKNIVLYQIPQDYAVINYDNAISRSFAEHTPAKVSYFSKEKLEPKLEGLELSSIAAQPDNVLAAVSVASIIGVSPSTILNGLRAFKPLPHRLEYVATVKGVRYYNDSFATTPEAAIAAIQYFSAPITLIVGGSRKGADYSKLADAIKNSPNVKAVICIGEEGMTLRKMLDGISDKNIVEGGSTMKAIVDKASNLAKDGGVVLLSPAAASFDMFKNASDRGDQFKQAVIQLTISS